MTTEDFIIELFCRIDDGMKGIGKHSQANLYPSEIVTLGVLFALKGVGNRAFTVGWSAITRVCSPSCPSAPGCFVCSWLIKTGPTASWLTRAC